MQFRHEFAALIERIEQAAAAITKSPPELRRIAADYRCSGLRVLAAAADGTADNLDLDPRYAAAIDCEFEAISMGDRLATIFLKHYKDALLVLHGRSPSGPLSGLGIELLVTFQADVRKAAA